LPYSTAVALVEGAALLPQYQQEKLADPEIARLSQLLTIEKDPTLPRGVSCHLTVETAGGRTVTAKVDHPRGSIVNPMSRDDMHGKVHLLADNVLGVGKATAMLTRVAGLEQLASVGELTRELAGAG
jgi:2-methylcitrate dehydratase PrpD